MKSIFSIPMLFALGALPAQAQAQKSDYKMPQFTKAISALAKTRFFEAISKNKIEEAQRLLLQGMNPDVQNSNGATALMFASYNGYLGLFQLLLQCKANVNLATKINKDFNVGLLLSNQTSEITALMLAAYTARIEIMAALLKAGVAVNACDSDGQTALTYAILGDKNWPHAPLSTQRRKIIELLLDCGADPNISDKNGLDPIYYYSCVAGLVPGFGGKFDMDSQAAESDSLSIRMR